MNAGLAVEVRDLVKRFGDFVAVDNVSLEVRRVPRPGNGRPTGVAAATHSKPLTSSHVATMRALKSHVNRPTVAR